MNKSFQYHLADIKGIFSTDLHYIQSGDERSIAVEASVDNLLYENSAIGNLACSAIYLPKEDNTHFVDARISLDGDVLTITTTSGTNLIFTYKGVVESPATNEAAAANN